MILLQSPLTKNVTVTKPRKLKPVGLMLHSVGCPQENPMAFFKNWDRPDIKVSVHAIIAPEAVYQLMPWEYRAYHCGGKANSMCIGVEMVEPKTIKYNFGANFTDRDPDYTKDFIQRTYNNAVDLFSYLCVLYHLNPFTDVISHKEGHRKGVASNHGDPSHLWDKYPELGLTMDNFRKAVSKHMNAENRDVFRLTGTGDKPSLYAQLACKWAQEKGLFYGDKNGNYGWQSAVTREQLAVILWRLCMGTGNT